jgi:hypothetical protein
VPFTFSHPAAAVPLARLRLPLSALVVGSMSPDFAYFLGLTTQARYGHSFAGLFWFCVPVGLAVLWVFHRVIKRPALDLLPAALGERLAGAAGPFAFGPLPRFAVVALGVWLGAVTHVVWDAFTWHDGFGVALFPSLAVPLRTMHADQPYGGYALYGYRVVQHVSTALGAGLLTFWTVRWLRRAPRLPLPSRLLPWERAAVWAVVLGGAALLAVRYASRFGDPFGWHWEVRAFAQMGMVSGIPLLFGLLTAYALAWRYLLPGPPPDAPHPEPPPPPRPPDGRGGRPT